MGTVAVVFDTNVLVSALGFGGTPLEALLRAVDDDGIELIVSANTLDELTRVMTYERLPFTERDRERFLTLLSRVATIVAPEVSVDRIDRDPDDDMFLECAIAGNATYVVSGDSHLLALGTFRGIEVVTPAEFLDRLK